MAVGRDAHLPQVKPTKAPLVRSHLEGICACRA